MTINQAIENSNRRYKKNALDETGFRSAFVGAQRVSHGDSEGYGR
jgi:hypothetical protein